MAALAPTPHRSNRKRQLGEGLDIEVVPLSDLVTFAPAAVDATRREMRARSFVIIDNDLDADAVRRLKRAAGSDLNGDDGSDATARLTVSRGEPKLWAR